MRAFNLFWLSLPSYASGAGMSSMDWVSSDWVSRPKLSEVDAELLSTIEDPSLDEDGKIAKLVSLCKDKKANIDAQENGNGSVLFRAIKLKSPALVRLLIDLKADVNLPALNSTITPLSRAISRWNINPNTPLIVEALCSAGADTGEIWSALNGISVPEERAEANMLAYFETIKILFKYSSKKNPQIFAEFLRSFVSHVNLEAPHFEIIKMFLSAGVDLFYEENKIFAFANAAREIVRTAIHRQANFAEVRNLLEHIPLLNERLKGMQKLIEICGGFTGPPSKNLQQFSKQLTEEIQAIKRLKVITWIFAQGFRQEGSSLGGLALELIQLVLLRIAKGMNISERTAKQIIGLYCRRPATAYTDGFSPLPLKLYYDPVHSDGRSPLPITLFYDPRHSDGCSPLPLSLRKPEQSGDSPALWQVHIFLSAALAFLGARERNEDEHPRYSYISK